MEPESILKSLLQFQLATDASAVKFLPYCLCSLTRDCFLASSHLTKWGLRINSLLHSKDSGGRWAGLCLAYKTSLLSQNVMVNSSLSWINVALSVLSKNESAPTVKAAIRLLCVIFTTGTNLPEFQRQVSLPNVVKFSSSVVAVANNHHDSELKVLCIETLSRLVKLYPTTHRSSSSSLSSFSLQFLNGSVSGPTNRAILNAASQLYSVLPLTGGKVGAIALWRKSLDETLGFGWDAFYSLRTTFPHAARNNPPPQQADEPQVSIPLCEDRLQCSVITLCSVLRAIDLRPVQIPLGNLIKFVSSLLNCSAEEKVDGFIDPLTRSMEISAIPKIWCLGSDLLICLTKQFPGHLNSYSSKLSSILASQLEKPQNLRERFAFLNALNSLLKTCYPLESLILPARLAKGVLPTILKMLSPPSGSLTFSEDEPSSKKSNHKGKKRLNNYQGDEVFKRSHQFFYHTAQEGEILLISIEIIQTLFTNPHMSSSIQSIIARTVISLLLCLPNISSASFSENPGLLSLVSTKIFTLSLVIGSGTTAVMSKALPFVVHEALTSNNCDSEIKRQIGLLLHPRLPPLLRSMPQVESLSLFKSEVSLDEAEEISYLEKQNYEQEKETPQPNTLIQDFLTIPPTPKNLSNAPVPRSESITPNEPTMIQTPSSDENEPLHNHWQLNKIVEQKIVQSTTPLPTQGPLVQPKIISSKYPPIGLPNQDEDEEMPPINLESDSDEED